MFSASKKTSKILIVDDIPKNIQVLASILHQNDYQIAYAIDGKSAIELVMENDFDLILLDIMMPETDGFEVCQQIRKNKEKDDIPIIFLTAKSDTESVVKGFSLGGQDYVTKPFNKDELLVRVKTQIELKKSREALQQANLSKDKFFSIIAHDLRNPVAGCQTLTELLDKYYDKFSEQERKKYFTMIKDATKQVYSLLINLLEWSRMQTNRIDFLPDEFNVVELIDEVIALYRPSAIKKQIKLTKNKIETAEVYADINMIKTVLRNLISNAIKFTYSEGQVKIELKVLPEKISVSVIDSGMGMSQDKIKNLFRIDINQRQDGTAKEKGTGLGLILCKEFIEKNNGSITIESQKEKGSTFTVFIPKAKEYNEL